MWRSAGLLANALAWAGLLGLIGGSAVLVRVLGFPGLLLLGLAAVLVCVRAELSEEVPGWGRSMAAADRSPARRAERRETIAALRSARGFALLLLALGLLGTAGQLWRG